MGARGSAAGGAAEAVAAAARISIDSSVGSHLGRGLRLFMGIPEILEIELVVRRLPRVMFKPGSVTLADRGYARGALSQREDLPLVLESLTTQVGAVDTKIQDQGTNTR